MKKEKHGKLRKTSVQYVLNLSAVINSAEQDKICLLIPQSRLEQLSIKNVVNEMERIKDTFEELMESGDNMRISVTLETENGKNWTVVEQTDAVVFHPEIFESGRQTELNFEDVIFHLNLDELYGEF